MTEAKAKDVNMKKTVISIGLMAVPAMTIFITGASQNSR